MELNFEELKEKQNLIPVEIPNKEKIYIDLVNLENSLTGRADAQIANTFISECIQLVINSIVLFEKGYFDCAYYSLRQTLELSTTIIYLMELDPSQKNEKIDNWKSQDDFPVFRQMIKFLNKNKHVYADIKDKIHDYFEDLKVVKESLNKTVHKQGFKTFYVSRSHPFHQNKGTSIFIDEFIKYVNKCIGAIAVLRLAIDPFPILLKDEQIFLRTNDIITLAYTDDFIEKYIGEEIIRKYKKTNMYISHYESIIKNAEAMNYAVANVVKDNFINRDEIDNILEQKQLLNENQLIAVLISRLSNKISKIYFYQGLLFYFTSIKIIRKKSDFNSQDFDKVRDSCYAINHNYHGAYLSYFNSNGIELYLEHNKKLDKNEIKNIEAVISNIK